MTDPRDDPPDRTDEIAVLDGSLCRRLSERAETASSLAAYREAVCSTIAAVFEEAFVWAGVVCADDRLRVLAVAPKDRESTVPTAIQLRDEASDGSNGPPVTIVDRARRERTVERAPVSVLADDPVREVLPIERADDGGLVVIPIETGEPRFGHLGLYQEGGEEFHGAGESFEDLGAIVGHGARTVRRRQTLAHERARLERFRRPISHDLRNVLNIARGRLDMALETIDSWTGGDVEQSPEHVVGSDEHVEECVEHVDENLEYVDDGLDRIQSIVAESLRALEAGAPLEERTLVQLRTHARRAWGQLATGDSSLEIDGDPRVRAAPDRLETLLSELCENAIEHADGPVTVTVGPLPGACGFFVEDDGPGIPPDERDLVFDRGYSSAVDGAGVGLAIVAEIAAAHGWTIDLSAGDRGGTRIAIDTTAAPVDSRTQ